MAPSEMRSVVVERDLAFPVTQMWEALTQPELIKDWLMPNDFMPELGHTCRFRSWR